MELITLSFALLFQLCILGNIHAEFSDAPKFWDYRKREPTQRRSRKEGHPRTLDKRRRILKFGRFDHAGRCSVEKCDWLGPKFPEKLGDLDQSFHGNKSTFGFKERKVKLSSLDYFLPNQFTQGNSVMNSTRHKLAKMYSRQSHIYDDIPPKILQYLYRTKRFIPSSWERLLANTEHGRKLLSRNPRSVFRRQDSPVGTETAQQQTNDSEPAQAESVANEVSTTANTECQTNPSAPAGDGNESRLPYDLDHNAYMAFGSLTFLLLVLTSAVMYTGLWKKRNTMLYPNFIDREQSSSKRKTDIRALLKAKLGKVPKASRRIRGRLHHIHRTHNHRHYSELPLVDNGDAHALEEEPPSSDEEIPDLLNSDEEEELYGRH